MASTVTLSFLGDIVAAPGRRVVEQQLPGLRADHGPDLVVADAENVARGSGCSARNYRRLRALGIDGITLGDHCFREPTILEILADPQAPIVRPANLPAVAPGRSWMRLAVPGTGVERRVHVFTVLGRTFMPRPGDDPFAAADRVLASIPDPAPLVVVEAHMEATAEKIALAHHLDGRVAAVLGTHTHVPTADARILPGGTAFMSDLGMCGPFDSCIGRDKRDVVRGMTTTLPVRYGIGSGDERMCGATVEIEVATGRARRIVPFQRHADPDLPPFSDRLDREAD